MANKVKRKSFNVGDTVLDGKYEILKIIHTSGMANVYLVLDKNLNKQWCLKEIVKSEAGKNMVEYRSLLQEANIMKSLSHSSIPRIVTMEEDGDSIFIVMDYVQGLSVKDWLLKKGTIEQSVVVKWMKQVCGVLIYLHNRKHPIFYRDMKPDNIMIQADGNIKVLDFGISVVITSKDDIITEALGTKGYAAPEQKKRGEKYDLRSDIFALGRTMYYMLTGINPSIVGDNLKPIREINSSLSMGLEVIVDKCTKENPDDRYQSVEEVLYALNNYDKLDSSYKSKARRKVNITLGCYAVSLLLLITSFIPLGLNNSQIDSLYKENLEIAIQTGRSSDYINAIKYKPLILEPYLGLIESFKLDGVFSKEEESQLLDLISPNLANMKENSEYGELAFNIGKLYWFYYEGDDGDIVSSKWFKESLDKGSHEKESKLFYDLSTFKKDIAMSIAESSDSGMYAEYWNNLMEAKSNINSGEIVELQIYNAISDAISSYAYRLKTDGVDKTSLDKEIDDIENFISVYNPISDKAKELFAELKQVSNSLQEKVNVAYSIGG